MIGKLPLNRLISVILTTWLFIRFTAILFEKHSVAIAIVTTSIVFSVIIILVLANLIKVLSNTKKKSQIEQNKSYNELADEPIDSFKHDILERKIFIKDLFKQIDNYNYPQTLTIAIYGDLGEGKTSALNLLKETIENSDKKDKYLTMDFNPWHYKDANAITQGFFYELKTSIHRGVFDEAGDALKKYSQILQYGTPKVALHRKLTHIEESLPRIADKINHAIEKQGRKIIVFIDEIERLPRPSILKIFELITSSAKFKNTIYVMSFDINYVSRILTEEGGMSFLEKIINFPVRLPPAEKTPLRKFLYKQISEVLKVNNFASEKRQFIVDQFANSYETKFEKIMKNLRDVKFFLNSFKISFPTVKNEVNVYDFLILTLIKIFYPGVYADICKNPEHYLNLDKSSGEISLAAGVLANPKLPKKEKTRHIENTISSEVRDENSKNIIWQLLLDIFPVRCKNKVSKACLNPYISEKEKRVCSEKCFARYFTCRKLSGRRKEYAKT